MIIDMPEKDWPTFIEKWIKNEEQKDTYAFPFANVFFDDFFTSENFAIKGFLDNDSSLQDTQFQGKEIMSPENIKNNKHARAIVCSPHYQAIREQLEAMGLKELEDFCNLADLYVLFNWYVKKSIVTVGVFSLVTTQCTLKCAACNMFMGEYSSHKTITLECLIANADAFFSNVDHTLFFVVQGGETLLYKQLEEYVEYVGENYRDKISYFSIATNGTLIPSDDLMAVCRKYNVCIEVSNYRNAGMTNYQKNFESCLTALERGKVAYSVKPFNREDSWRYYYRRDDSLESLTQKQLQQHYRRCMTCSCVLLHDEKIYPCGPSWSAEQCGLAPAGSADFISLKKVTSGKQGRFELVKYFLGYCQDGHLPFCRSCYGLDPHYVYHCPAGMQKEKE